MNDDNSMAGSKGNKKKSKKNKKNHSNVNICEDIKNEDYKKKNILDEVNNTMLAKEEPKEEIEEQPKEDEKE